MSLPFELDVCFNPVSWGPSMSVALPEDALNATASKSDRLYLFVNFLDQRVHTKRPFGGAGGAPAAGGAGGDSPVVPPEEDMTGFVVKDTVAPTWRPHHGPRPPKAYTPRPPSTHTHTHNKQPFRGMSGMIDKTSKLRARESSVAIGSDWELLSQFDLVSLGKLAVNVPSVVDVKWAGRLGAYDDKIDRSTAARPKPLVRHTNRVHCYTRVKQDSIMMDLAGEGVANVFVTDAVAAHLMCAAKANYPWDIIFMYLGGTIFIDVREQDKFERLTVHETANKQPSDDADPLNSANALSEEATRVHQDYTQQIVNPADVTAAGAGAGALGLSMEPLPFWEQSDYPGKQPASVAYRYRKWSFQDDVSVVVRSTVHACDVARRRCITSFALNEWDHKDARAVSGSLPWKGSLDTRKGQVLGAEIRNNNAKFSRWMTQTLLSGCEEMRVGFVSRAIGSSKANHNVLGVQSFATANAAQMFSLSQTNMWGVIKWAVDLVRVQAAAKRGDTPDDDLVAKFVLVKDPNRSVLSLYSVDPDLFEPVEEVEPEAEE